MSGNAPWKVGDRVTLNGVSGDAYPWMVGLPGTVIQPAAGGSSGYTGPKVKFDKHCDRDEIDDTTGEFHDCNYPHEYGWWVDAHIVVAYRSTPTSHEVW